MMNNDDINKTPVYILFRLSRSYCETGDRGVS